MSAIHLNNFKFLLKRIRQSIYLLMTVLPASPVLAQESFNVYGNRFQNFADYGVAQFGEDKLVFGVMEPLGVTCMNFTEGDLWNIRFFLRENMQEKAIYGTGGTVENDSVFLVLGRMGTANTTVIKATSSGEVLWANWYNTGSDERPDKIVRLQNGDYLVSVRTNISYYEFGEWGSRSGVMRIDSRGRLKWFRILDQRSLNTYSLLLGMHETRNGDLILTQAYNAKLGLITLSADGDSMRSLRSVSDVNPTHSAYDAQRGILYLVNANRRLIQFDSSSKWLSTTRIDASSLQSFNQVYLMNDSSLVLGGKYQNTAAMLNCDLQGTVRSAYSRNSDLLGIFPEENGYVSLIRQGYMVSRHPNGAAPGCFSTISATVFSTASESAIALESHVPITGSAVYGGWASVYTKKDQSLILKSTNCLRKDLATRPDKDSFNQTCPQFSPRLYLTNHGTTNVSSGMLELKLNGAVYSNARVDLPSALGPKGSVFINLPQMQLSEGWNAIEGNFYQVDGESDGFTANNSFKISVRTRTGFKPRLNGPDSVCPGSKVRFVVSGGEGETISWYRDRTQLEKQGSQNSFETGTAGTYHAVVSDSGCLYYSDTLKLSLLPAPTKPIITYNAQTGQLSTDAEPPFIWFLDGQPVDTSSTTLNAMEYGAGSYVVRAFNSSNCTTESDAVLVETGSVGQIAQGQLPIEIQGNQVRWLGDGKASLQVYGLDGRLLFSTSIGAEAVQFHVPRSVYILQIRSGGHSGAFRVLMGE